MYYSMVGTISTIVIAIIASYITKSDTDEYDEKLLHPWVLAIRRYFAYSNDDTGKSIVIDGNDGEINNDDKTNQLKSTTDNPTIDKLTMNNNNIIFINDIENDNQTLAIANAAFVHDDNNSSHTNAPPPIGDVNKMA